MPRDLDGASRRRIAWNAKEVVRQIYHHTDPVLAAEWVAEIGRDFTDREMPFEGKQPKWLARERAILKSFLKQLTILAIQKIATGCRTYKRSLPQLFAAQMKRPPDVKL